MKINRVILVLNIILLVLSVNSLAEDLPNPGYFCETDLDCEELSAILITFEEIDKAYPKCNIATKTCYDSGTAAAQQTTTNDFINIVTNATTNTTTSIQTANLNSQVTQLKQKIDQLTIRINSLESSESTFEQQLVGLNSELQSVSGSLQSIKQVQGELNVVAVGLAGLQQNLENTTSEVAAIEASLEKKTARNKAIGFTVVILLALAVFGFLAY